MKYPADSLPLHKAYWRAAGKLYPSINEPHPLPKATDKEALRFNEALQKEFDEQFRSSLQEFDKRFRMSLADQGQANVALQVFIVHPDTRDRVIVDNGLKWLDPSEAINVSRFDTVATASGAVLQCPWLLVAKDVDRWIEEAARELGIATFKPDQLSKRRTRGRPHHQRDPAMDKMRADIRNGKQTLDTLTNMKQTALSEEYGVSRKTAQDALSEIVKIAKLTNNN